jgi:hypothetical protein
MTGTPLATYPWPTRFARSSGTPSKLSPTALAPGRVMGHAPEGTSSRGFRLASCIECAVRKLKSSPWLTAGDVRVIGVPDSNGRRTSGFTRRSSAAGDPARSPHIRNAWARRHPMVGHIRWT